MKAKKVYENIDFERGQEPKDKMDIGLRRPGDEEVIEDIILRKRNESPERVLINLKTGAEYPVPLFSLKHVLGAIKTLFK